MYRNYVHNIAIVDEKHTLLLVCTLKLKVDEFNVFTEIWNVRWFQEAWIHPRVIERNLNSDSTLDMPCLTTQAGEMKARLGMYDGLELKPFASMK